MTQNTLWIIVGLSIVLFVLGGFTLAAENKAPGIILMVVSATSILVSIGRR